MKRIFVLLVILALIPLVCADPTADSLSVGSASGDPGATYVPVQVVITNVADGPIQGITLNVTYASDVIELAAAAAGSDLPEDFLGNSLWKVKLGSNKKSITMYTDDQSYALTDGTTGNILNLYFNVNATATPGYYPIEISDVDVGSTDLVHGTIPTINGTFTVNGTVPDPVLCTSPDPPSNDFGSVPTGEARTWTFDITNSGAGTLDWTVVDDQDWITVSPEGGSDAGTVTVTIDTTGLAVGVHTGTITVGSSYGTKTGSISLTVPDSVDPVLCTDPDPPSNDFGIVPAGETRTWTFDVTNCGGEGTLAWTVVDDQDWITVSPESGSDAGTVTVTIDTTGLAVGAHTGTITVGSSYGTKTGTINVTSEVLEMCLGTCCNDSECNESYATDMTCAECIALGKHWHPNKDTACFGDKEPSDLCLDWCPECCDCADNDSDTNIDYPADEQCTCGLDPSETTSLPPIPELATFALIGVGLMLVVGLMRFGRR